MKTIIPAFIRLFLGLIFLGLLSCNRLTPSPHYPPRHDPQFPKTPMNLEAFNSVYDDYNSAAPDEPGALALCFSTNRMSGGTQFDIIYKPLYYDFNYETGDFSVSDHGYDPNGIVENSFCLNDALSKINTSSDEFGPYLIHRGSLTSSQGTLYEAYVFMYASGKDGDQDIYFTHNLLDEHFEQPHKVAFLSSPGDDFYPTFNRRFNKIYFSSNRDSIFNIYHLNIDNTQGLIQALSSADPKPVFLDTLLSSSSNDKCPFINGNLMVFASDRPGGFGGYDLYYSILKDGHWSQPVNFGDRINTPYDEFRPIVIKASRYSTFRNDMMIFSSNRPGGKGGFDLYLVGIDKTE